MMMKRAWAARAGVFGGALVAVWAMGAGVAESCPKACPDAQKDARGCCPAQLKPAASPQRDGMVRVPEGEFIRGADAGDKDERPKGKVGLGAYWIDAHEVTVGAYAACVKAGACAAPKMKGAERDNWGADGPREDRLRHPINGVDWAQAAAFCAWEGKRLPTEAEWEKAARGTDGRTYPWGEAQPSCKQAVFRDGERGCGQDKTWEVGSKPEGASPYGAHDMAGNVSEWTADWYDKDYYASAESKARDPKGASAGSLRVLRGGSWADAGKVVRAANRVVGSPTDASPILGFRCAASD